MPPKKDKPQPVYRVIFRQQDKLIELHAHEVVQSTMMAFIEIGEMIFDTKTDVVVDPSLEKLKAEFGGVKRTYIPMHAVLRIDEVEKTGVNKIRELRGEPSGNVTSFPYPGGNR